jgi:hypothetical protein
VACEKPLTLNVAQARAAVELAQSKNLFLREALWMRFNPAIRELDQWVSDGTLGEIVHVQVDNSFLLPFDPTHRLSDLEQAGGALPHLRIYSRSKPTTVSLYGCARSAAQPDNTCRFGSQFGGDQSRNERAPSVIT